MILSEQVYAQAAMLAGKLEENQAGLLRVLCGITTSSLAARLKEGLTPGDCKADFIAAASLYALAALNGAAQDSDMQEFKAGDLSIKKGSSGKDAASRCLQRQADLIIAPYLKDRFAFLGV